MTSARTAATELGELVDGSMLNAQDLANACGVNVAWVHARVEAGVLSVEGASEVWRFDSVALIRARRIAHLEASFDADPQLAALMADLIEELVDLRRQLRALSVAIDD